MPTPSPSFTFTGAAGPLLKKQATAAGSVVATLDSLSGVSTVTWSLVGVDETRTIASYTLTPSGTLGSICTITAGVAGTAAILKCTVNGGINAQGRSDASLSATAKWWVPATGTNLEVGCVGEDDESDPVYGWVSVVNPAIRNVVAGGVTSVSATAPLTSSGGATPNIGFTATANRTLESNGAGTNITTALYATAATASSYCKRGASGEAGFGAYVEIGTGTVATTGTVRFTNSATLYGVDSGAANAVVCSWNGGANTLTLGGAGVAVMALSATRANGSISYDAGSAGVHLWTINSSNIFRATAAVWETYLSTLRFEQTVSTPTITHEQRTGDNAAQALIVASQTPSATSTGANRDAKRIRLQIPAPQGAGAESYVGVEISGTERAQIGRYSAVFNDGNSGKAVRIGAYYPAGSPGTTYAAIYFGTGATSPNSTTYGFLGDSADTYLNAPTGTLYLMKAGAVHTTLTEAGSAYTITLGPTVSMLLTAAATTAAITANKAQALTISIGTQTTDTAPQTITFTPGQPWASATSANRKPGDVVTALGAPTNSGTTHAAVRVTRGASSLILEDKGEVTTTDATSTVVYSYTLADTTAVHLRARMVSFRTDSGTNCNVNVLEAGCKRRGGGATLVGAVTTTLKEDSAFTSYTATVSGNDLRVEVQARVGETWKHRVHVEIVAEVIT
jgi:hypothetical protein